MSSKVPMPASGNPDSKGAADGVSGAPGNDAGNSDGREVHGRSKDGESGGGAYPNPHSGKTPENTGFMSHGGQTDVAYHGSGQAGDDGGSAPNGVAGSGATRDTGESTTAPVVEHKAHSIATERGSIDVVETSGVAEVEATGKVATDGQDDEAQAQPGSG